MLKNGEFTRTKIMNELYKINKELDNINVIKQNSNNYNSYQKNDFKIHMNSNSSYALNEIISIKKGIDSVYDNLQLMKGNKINSKILYNINNFSQTYE